MTWEDIEELRQRFPRAPACGQVGDQGRGNVNAAPADQATAQDDQATEDVSDEKDPPARRVGNKSRRYREEEWVVG